MDTDDLFFGKPIREMDYEEYRAAVRSSDGINRCPIQPYLGIFSGKWNLRIMFELARHDSMRFGELRRAIPEISNMMLSSTLQDLCAAGVVSRTQYEEIPPRVEYAMTELGSGIERIYYEMARWCDAASAGVPVPQA